MSLKNPLQKNSKVLPDGLKNGVENLSGIDMDNVKVHYNSKKPAQLNAHACAQGYDIHLSPGEQQHLAHEAWYVVQQKQGRVNATTKPKANTLFNDDLKIRNRSRLNIQKSN